MTMVKVFAINGIATLLKVDKLVHGGRIAAGFEQQPDNNCWNQSKKLKKGSRHAATCSEALNSKRKTGWPNTACLKQCVCCVRACVPESQIESSRE